VGINVSNQQREFEPEIHTKNLLKEVLILAFMFAVLSTFLVVLLPPVLGALVAIGLNLVYFYYALNRLFEEVHRVVVNEIEPQPEPSKQITLEMEYTDREGNLEAALEKIPTVESVDGYENRVIVVCDSDVKMEVFSKAKEYANIENFSSKTH
jgi:hypothetical protein